jgi:hypothetical protein
MWWLLRTWWPVFANDGDGVVGDEDQYRGVGVGDADAEVV